MSNQNVSPSQGASAPEQLDFVREIVKQHLAEAKYKKIVTRFPPEPNGYLHIGHAKSICLNFGIARQFAGVCNLRMDDTNPTKEDVEYEDSIVTDVRWLIAGWADHCLGLKPKGKTPAAQAVNGKRDFYLPAVTPHPNPLPQGERVFWYNYFSFCLILLFTLLQESVIRKLSFMFPTMRMNLLIGIEKVRTFSGTHGRADTSNIPKTHLGCSDLFSK